MCGRYTLTAGAPDLVEEFGLDETPELEARYNIAPSQQVPGIILDPRRGARELRWLRWGLVPHWAADPAIGNRMINARSESVADRPAFRDPFRRSRCLIPANGFFEWQAAGPGRKQPHLLRMNDGRTFAFAGLWDRWEPLAGEPIESFTILTTRPNELAAPIHDRMPVILPRETYGPWLDITTGADELQSWLRPYPAEEMVAIPVSTRVNDPGNDDASCVEPLPPSAVDNDRLF